MAEGGLANPLRSFASRLAKSLDMKIERRDDTAKSTIEARALEMLLPLLNEAGRAATFLRWGNDKTEPDAYIKLDDKTIGIEITQIWGESPTEIAKATVLEQKLMERVKETICRKQSWRGCISVHLLRYLRGNDDINSILAEVEKNTVGIEKGQEVHIQLRNGGSITMQPWKNKEEEKISSLLSMSLCSDEDNTPFIKAIEQTIDRKKHHRYGEPENWLLCLDRSVVGLLMEDSELKTVARRIEELRPSNFDRIIVLQSTTEGNRGIYTSNGKNRHKE